MKLIVSDRYDPAYHLALEEYLFHQHTDEFALFYVNTPCVIIGSNQVWKNEVNEEFCAQYQIPVLRRMSGGGAVYHDLGNLNYSFIKNQSVGERIPRGAFLKPIVSAFSYFGFQPVVGQRKDLWLPDGFKMSGTASHLAAKRELHHGTLLYDANIDHLTGALNSSTNDTSTKGIPSVPSPVKNIIDYLKEVNLPVYEAKDFYAQLIQQVTLLLSINESFVIDAMVEAQINSLADSKYLTNEWNKRK